jgi:prepilin-type processing-associated H-X9-DG protein
LVAVTIVGSLVALLLPALQASRERSRQTVCANNLRQQGLAVQQHVQAFGRFPSNGWGYLWVGDPDRGNDLKQPGGWIYNLIVYTQPKTHRDLGKRGDVRGGKAAFERLLSEPAPLFVCPSRGDGRPRPAAPWLPPFNAEFRPLVAKTDYAICEGDYITDTQGGPESLEQGDTNEYAWKDTGPATGVSYLRSAVRPAHVTDGLSHTYLIGEKYVSYGGYESHDDPGYDQTMYTGVDLDLNRWTLEPPLPDGREWELRRFGSAHPEQVGFAFCDGSVRQIRFAIDPQLHRSLGHRSDGAILDEAKL